MILDAQIFFALLKPFLQQFHFFIETSQNDYPIYLTEIFLV
jgi:hypothetical protein